MPKAAYVYILANRKNGALYTGVTSDLACRMVEHKTKAHPGFTAEYGVDQLMWYMAGQDIRSAIELEKKIKNRNRSWKVALIERTNPTWRDLSQDFLAPA